MGRNKESEHQPASVDQTAQVDKTRHKESLERRNPHEYLNDYLMVPVMHLMAELEHAQKFHDGDSVTLSSDANHIERGALNFLCQTGMLTRTETETGHTYSPTETFTVFPETPGHSLVPRIARLQKQALLDQNIASVRSLAKGYPELKPLLPVAAQALMIYSYDDALNHLSDIYHGRASYGLDGDYNRTQPENALGAGLMMLLAAQRIARHLVELQEQGLISKDFAVLELGSGNASTLKIILEVFGEKGLDLPQILATDIDPETRLAAYNFFEKNGLLNHFDWMQLDMKDKAGIKEALARINENQQDEERKQLVIHIGFILHENRELAEQTIAALTEVLPPDTIYVFSEYHRGPDGDPWFEGLHDIFGQELFDLIEFLTFCANWPNEEDEARPGKPLKLVSSVIHSETENGEPKTSSTFWQAVA